MRFPRYPFLAHLDLGVSQTFFVSPTIGCLKQRFIYDPNMFLDTLMVRLNSSSYRLFLQHKGISPYRSNFSRILFSTYSQIHIGNRGSMSEKKDHDFVESCPGSQMKGARTLIVSTVATSLV